MIYRLYGGRLFQIKKAFKHGERKALRTVGSRPVGSWQLTYAPDARTAVVQAERASLGGINSDD